MVIACCHSKFALGSYEIKAKQINLESKITLPLTILGFTRILGGAIKCVLPDLICVLPLLIFLCTPCPVKCAHSWGLWCQASQARISNCIPQFVWDVVIYHCLRYLILARKSSCRFALYCFVYITCMMTSSNGNIFRVTGPLCGEFTGPGEFPTQRPVTRSFDVYFDLRLNKRLCKQS